MKAILTLLVLFLSIPAFAADGDRCPAAIRPVDDSGDLVEHCILLCDQKTDLDSTCDDHTIESLPTQIIIDIAEDDVCSAAAQVAINHKGHASLDSHAYTTLVRGGSTAVVVAADGMPLPVLEFNLSTMTDCDDFTVIGRFRYKR